MPRAPRAHLLGRRGDRRPRQGRPARRGAGSAGSRRGGRPSRRRESRHSPLDARPHGPPLAGDEGRSPRRGRAAPRRLDADPGPAAGGPRPADAAGRRPPAAPRGPQAGRRAARRRSRRRARGRTATSRPSGRHHADALAAAGRSGRPVRDDGRASPRPAVLVLGGSEGGLSRNPTAELLASHGYDTLQLAYFGERGLPAELERIPLEYFVRALHWLAARPGASTRISFLRLARRRARAHPRLALPCARPRRRRVRAELLRRPRSTASRLPGHTVGCRSGTWLSRAARGRPNSAEGRAAASRRAHPRAGAPLVGGDDDFVCARPATSYGRSPSLLRARGKRNFASVADAHAGHAVAAKLPLLPLATFSSSGRARSAPRRMPCPKRCVRR